MTVNIPTRSREEILCFAGRLTCDPSDYGKVAANALPLLEWLESAASETEMELRLTALRRRHVDTGRAMMDHQWEPADDPGAWLEGAKLYAAFLAGGAL